MDANDSADLHGDDMRTESVAGSTEEVYTHSDNCLSGKIHGATSLPYRWKDDVSKVKSEKLFH